MTPAKTTKPGKKRGPKTMSADHKAALAVGRVQGTAVRNYLDAITANKPKRGRKRTAATIEARLAKLDVDMGDADPLRLLKLTQERINLNAELATMGKSVDLTALEAAFVKAAKGYGERKGITYAAWRQVGVTAEVLAKAGITRGRG